MIHYPVNGWMSGWLALMLFLLGCTGRTSHQPGTTEEISKSKQQQPSEVVGTAAVVSNVRREAGPPAWSVLGGNSGKTYRTTSSISKNSGRVVWSYASERPIVSGEPLVGSDSTIYFLVPGKAIALQPDGKLKWELPLKYSLPVAWALSAEMLYVASTVADYDANWHQTSIAYQAELQAISLEGVLKWTKEFETVNDLITGPDGMLYVAAGVLRHRGIQAITPDGKLGWAYLPSEYDSAFTQLAMSDGVISTIQSYYGSEYRSPRLITLTVQGRPKATSDLGYMLPTAVSMDASHVYLTGRMLDPPQKTTNGGYSIGGAGYSELRVFNTDLHLQTAVPVREAVGGNFIVSEPGKLVLECRQYLCRFDYGQQQLVPVYENVRQQLGMRTDAARVTPLVADRDGGLLVRVLMTERNKISTYVLYVSSAGAVGWKLELPATTVSIGPDGSIYALTGPGSIFAIR